MNKRKKKSVFIFSVAVGIFIAVLSLNSGLEKGKASAEYNEGLNERIAIETRIINSDEYNAVIEVAEEQFKEIPVEELVLNDSYHVIDVPYIYQGNGYPSGCEVVSTTMALRYYGFQYSVDDVIDMLPKSDIYYENGEMISGSPYTSFIGNPKSENSFGCFAPVIEDVLGQAVGDEYRILNKTGTSLDELCLRYIQNDKPVIVWETICMLPSYLSSTWRIEGTSDYFTWIAQEHCMVLVGYDDYYYYFNDPYKPQCLMKYDKSIAEARYEELGKQALVIY